MEKIKCITFDKKARNSIPEHIKAKMKTDREKAENTQKKLNIMTTQELNDIYLHNDVIEVSNAPKKECRKLSESEQLKIARLGVMRVWNMKQKSQRGTS